MRVSNSMNSTSEYSGTLNYSAKATIWPGYMPFSPWIIADDLGWGREFFCSDSLAVEINKAIGEAEDPKGHTTYNTIEEFLSSLRSR